jgi:hypothetical protein
MSCFAFNPIHEEMMEFSKEEGILLYSFPFLLINQIELRIEKGKSILKEEIIKARFKIIIGETNSIKLEEAIKCLEEFDYCFKLSEEEEKIYKDNGYLFPSLRPEGSFALGISIFFL